ncbi:hypothetical protein HP550_05870 [Cellulomonas humilata]|uniref:DUF6311 domain-containing protein n=1 Tax=Cellulomonas humilata TaxID=144055 RepID=A0A7Y5ZZB1_9CELL|nr:hypothetical protein [Cellulomonas humilata]NUU16775.1 hypothetical protein [Cellulomonas humilata]
MRGRATTGRLSEVLVYATAAMLALVSAAWALRLTRVDWHVPFSYSGDAVAIAAHVKTTLTTGWYEHQPLLGWPAGQIYHDYPLSEDLHLLLIKLLGAVLGDWAVTLNVYFVLGFPLAALTAAYFLRRIGVGRAMTVVGATLFALAPYHFSRGETHLFLASYWVLPPALLVVVRVWRGEPLWSGGTGAGLRLGRWRLDTRALSTGLALVLVATGSTYYAVFTLCLLGIGALVAMFYHRDDRRFLGAAAAGAVLVATLALLMVPDLLYARAHGANQGALFRNQAGSEVYALKLAALLLPVPGHAIRLLADVRTTYDDDFPLPGEFPSLGLVAAAGLLALLVIVVVQVARPASHPSHPGVRLSMLVSLGGLALVALLLSTVGGVSSLISFLTPNVRGWNRMSIVLALLSLAAVGLLLDHAAGRLRARTSRAVAMVTLVAGGTVLIVLGTLDQASPLYRPDHQSVQATFRADADWVGQVEETFGDDAAVFQLPFMSYPESPAVNGVADTDQLRPFLHSDTLRWSGGGIKGRPESAWPSVVAGMPVADAQAAMLDAGFSAVVLDTQALGDDDGGVERAWRALVGAPVVEGADGRYLVFDLRS